MDRCSETQLQVTGNLHFKFRILGVLTVSENRLCVKTIHDFRYSTYLQQEIPCGKMDTGIFQVTISFLIPEMYVAVFFAGVDLVIA